jgi:serine/threonine protein kinase
MAPEQASGQRCGPPADLYGLGASLYFAVEGRAPFADTGSWETTQAVRTQPPRPGVRLGALKPVVDALLAKDPSQRPSSAEVDAALAGVAGAAVGPRPEQPAPDAPVVPPPPGTPSLDDDGHQLRRMTLWVALLLALLAVALVLLFLAVREQDKAAVGLAGTPVYHGAVAARRRS